MLKSLILKEWLKTRVAALIGFALMALMCVYAVMSMNRVATLKGPDHLWLIMLLKDQTFVDVLRYVPLLIGVVFGLAQWLPEMAQKRLKLTLHLPMGLNRMIGLMLTVGAIELLIIFLLGMGIIAYYDGMHLHPTLTWMVLATMAPWMLAGLQGYFATCAVCIEPVLWRRIILAILGIGVVTIYYIQPVPEAYNSFLPLLILLIVASSLLVWGAIYRFKEGAAQ